jgi:DNA-directed RNA polymerase subunit omega
MLEELKEEAIVNKVGGRFKLSTLIQKRMVSLNTGAKPLVDVRGGDKLAIVIQEILQDKIYLDATGALHTRNQTIMANLPGSYPGMPGAQPAAPGTSSRAVRWFLTVKSVFLHIYLLTTRDKRRFR